MLVCVCLYICVIACVLVRVFIQTFVVITFTDKLFGVYVPPPGLSHYIFFPTILNTYIICFAVLRKQVVLFRFFLRYPNKCIT